MTTSMTPEQSDILNKAFDHLMNFAGTMHYGQSSDIKELRKEFLEIVQTAVTIDPVTSRLEVVELGNSKGRNFFVIREKQINPFAHLEFKSREEAEQILAQAKEREERE